MNRIVVLLLALCLSVPVLAHATSDAELLAIDARWNALRLQPDVEGLDRLLADDWLLTHSDGRVQTKSEYLDELRTRTRRNQAIDNEDVRLRRYGNTVVVTGTSVQSAVSNGQPWSGRFRFTRVWVRRGGGWIMVASHSSRIETTP
jgi:hypothetical protein